MLEVLCEVRIKTEAEREKEKEKEEEEKQENQARKNDIFNRSSQPELVEEEREREREREGARFLRALGFAPIAADDTSSNTQVSARHNSPFFPFYFFSLFFFFSLSLLFLFSLFPLPL